MHARRYGGLGAVVAAALLSGPAASADGPSSWQGPVKLADRSSELHVEPARIGTDGVAVGWTEGPGAMVAYRAQGEGPLRTPLRIYDTDPDSDIWPTGQAFALRDGNALAFATSDVSDRTLVLAADGARGPLQDWGDGCGVGALADSPVAGTAAIRVCAGSALSYSLTRRAVGALGFQDPQPSPIAGGDLPDLAVDDSGRIVATWLDDCDATTATCAVMAATATPEGSWSTPRRLGVSTQANATAGVPEPLLSVDENGDGVIAWPQEDAGAHHVMIAPVTGSTTIGDPAVAASDTSPVAMLFDVESYHGAVAVEWLTDVSLYDARLVGAVRATAADTLTTTVLASSFGHAAGLDLRPSPAAASPDHRTFAMTLSLEAGGERTILWRAGASSFTRVDDANGGGEPRVDVGDGGTALATWASGNGADYSVADAASGTFSAPAAVPGYAGWYGPEVADQAVDPGGDVLIEDNDRAAPSPAQTQAYIRPAGGAFGAALPGLRGIYANGAGAALFSAQDAFVLRADSCGDLAYFALSTVSVPATADCTTSAGNPTPDDISASAQPLVTPPAPPAPPDPGSPPPALTTPVGPPASPTTPATAAGPPGLQVRLRRDGSLALTVSCRQGCRGRLTMRLVLGSLHLRAAVTLALPNTRPAKTYRLRFRPGARRRLRHAGRAGHPPKAALTGAVTYRDGRTWHGTVITRVVSAHRHAALRTP